jgi:hypothetical protein
LRHFAISLTLALFLAGETQAGTSHIAQGLFCNTHEQIAGAFRSLSEGLSMTQSIAAANEEKVVCVWADRIGYMITAPAPAQSIMHDGAWLSVYEAWLVGVLVGGNPRPVEPSVQIYFVPSEKLPASILTGNS